jgi:hypothetical protein
VPEVRELKTLAAYFRGLSCLEQDKCEEAEGCLGQCASMPREYHVSSLLLRAEAGAAFRKKDYDRFERLAEDAAKQQPGDAIAQAQVASALACEYAVSGNEALRRRAEAKLDEANRMDSATLGATHYVERIRHRLETREIIDSKEFFRRFPNGWHPSGASRS